MPLNGLEKLKRARTRVDDEIIVTVIFVLNKIILRPLCSLQSGAEYFCNGSGELFLE
jgi:hypothetical protein